MAGQPLLDRPRFQAACLAAALCVHAGLALASARRKSITTDELPHITAGYSYWKRGDFRLNPEHPPLAKLLGGLGLLLLENPPFRPPAIWWQQARRESDFQFPVANHFFFRTPPNLAHHRHLLFAARLPMVLMGLVLCAYVFFLARLLFGPRAAYVSLAVAALSPTVLAHTRLVTTDVGVTAFWVGAVYHTLRFLRDPRRRHLAAAAVLTGLAMATKFSGILALGVTGLAGLLAVVFPDGSPWARGRTLGERLQRFTGDMILYVGLALLVVATAYFFADFPRYFRGFAKVWANHDPRYQSFFLGRWHQGIVWPYYLVALAVKMPLGTLALALLGLWPFRPWGLRRAEAVVLFLPAALIFTVSTLAGRYLGVRYVLPCLPLLFLLAGRAAATWGRRWAGGVLVGGLTLAVAVSVVRAFPDYIPYFNEAAGGVRGGAYLLDDSNIDWGQDWIAVAAFQRERGIRELRYWPHNRIDPCKPYGIRGRMIEEEEVYLPRTGWYVVGAHTLNRNYIFSYSRAIFFDWHRRYEPVAVLGASWVFRFWIENEPPPAGFRGVVLTPEENLRQALGRLDRYIAYRPDDGGLHWRKARLLARLGRREEARRELGQVAPKGRARLARVQRDIRRGRRLNPFLRRAALETLQEECQEQLRGADAALALAAPAPAEACLAVAADGLRIYEALPPAAKQEFPWPPEIRRRALLILRGLAARAAALRAAAGGDGRELERRCALFNRFARAVGAAERLEPARLLAAARKLRQRNGMENSR